MTTKPQPKQAVSAPVTRQHGDRKIVRDETFVRATVDEIMPLVLGRDIDLCCLQFSPILNGMLDKGDHFVPELDLVFTEVARVRINYSDAVELAMSILAQGISSDRVNGKAVITSVEQWIAEFEAQEAVSTDDDAR